MLMEAHGRCVLLGALLLAARIQRGSASDAAGEAFLAQVRMRVLLALAPGILASDVRRISY